MSLLSAYAYKKKYKNSLPLKWVIAFMVMFTLYSLVCVLPLLLVLAVSFSSESDVYTYGYRFIPKSISLNAYKLIFANSSQIFEGYATTIFSTVLGTVCSLLISSAIAYPLSRKDFKYRNRLSFYVYFTMLFNGGMIPLYLIYTQLIPLRNNIFCLVLPNMISAFYVLLIKTYMKNNLPDSIVESAEIDGASVYRIFFTIVLPLVKPVLATVALFTSIQYWNDYFRNMLFVYDGSINNLQYLLYRIQQQIELLNTNPDVAASLAASGGGIPSETSRMAMVIITVGPIIFVYPFLQKYFVKGLTIGAVKG